MHLINHEARIHRRNVTEAADVRGAAPGPGLVAFRPPQEGSWRGCPGPGSRVCRFALRVSAAPGLPSLTCARPPRHPRYPCSPAPGAPLTRSIRRTG